MAIAINPCVHGTVPGCPECRDLFGKAKRLEGQAEGLTAAADLALDWAGELFAVGKDENATLLRKLAKKLKEDAAKIRAEAEEAEQVWHASAYPDA